MFDIDNVYKSADIVKESGQNFTISEWEKVSLVLQESGEVIEGMITRILTKSIEIKVEGEVGARKFSYANDIADIKRIGSV
ncbi:MAG: hypothetical protein K9K76_07500 [Halanaerobiales bacterium]|nr:hypothetical protein [Halanaerobiales bacterium]